MANPPGMPSGGMPDMQQLMQQAQLLQAQMVAAQQELADAEVEGSAGGGLVTATVTGTGELTALVIDPKVVDPEDVETLTDLVISAVQDAARHAAELQQGKLGPLAGAGGMGGGMPGLPF